MTTERPLICWVCWVNGQYEVFNPAMTTIDGRALCERHARETTEAMIEDVRGDDG